MTHALPHGGAERRRLPRDRHAAADRGGHRGGVVPNGDRGGKAVPGVTAGGSSTGESGARGTAALAGGGRQLSSSRADDHTTRRALRSDSQLAPFVSVGLGAPGHTNGTDPRAHVIWTGERRHRSPSPRPGLGCAADHQAALRMAGHGPVEDDSLQVPSRCFDRIVKGERLRPAGEPGPHVAVHDFVHGFREGHADQRVVDLREAVQLAHFE